MFDLERKIASARRSSFVRVGLLLAFAAGGAHSASAQFGPEQLIESGGPGAYGVHASDLDGDGDLDVIAGRDASPALVWYENLGGGAFGLAQQFPLQPFSASQVATVDHDSDGDQDVLALVDYYTPQFGTYIKVVLYRNDGGGSFVQVPAALVNGGSLGTLFALADLEGDGYLDFFYSSQASIYVKRGNGTDFDSFAKLLTDQALGARDFHPADLDGDGDTDLVAALYSLNQVVWFENLGNTGPFGPKQILNSQADGALGVCAADLDGDGDLDSLSSSTSGFDKEVMWYENLGNGQFGAGQLITTIGYPGTDVLAVDIDGDGDRDVVPYEFFGTSWYPNHGGGNFGPRQVISEGASVCKAVELADLNGDGVPDALLGFGASGIPGKLAWFDNQVIGPLGSNYCGPAVPNSTGAPGTIQAVGSPVVAVDKVRLIAGNLPASKVGLFIASRTQGFAPHLGGGAGTLCLAGSIRRIPPALTTGSAGGFALDLALASSLGAPVQPGETWRFQAWHRDVGPTTNLTDGLQIQFMP